MMRVRPGERGAALLAVLILVAVTGAIAAASLEKLSISRAVALNSASIDQARYFALAAEQLGVLIVDDLVAQDRSRTTLAGGWNGATRTLPMPGGGLVEARLRDGGNCFNVNSVVQGGVREGLLRRPTGLAQFATLMQLVGIPPNDADRIAAAASDWADSDTVQEGAGAEDPAYAQGDPPFRTGNTLFGDVSELRVLPGMTPAHYARLRPYLCALPVAELSPINVNTLLPHQAALLAMLSPGRLSEAAARRVLAARPAAGWANSTEFWRNDLLATAAVPFDAQQQAQLRTQWFALDISSRVGESEHYETALLDARLQPTRIARRRWEREGADMAALAR